MNANIISLGRHRRARRTESKANAVLQKQRCKLNGNTKTGAVTTGVKPMPPQCMRAYS